MYCTYYPKKMAQTHRPRIYSIEGNIGAGKSTLLSHLKAKYAADKRILFMQEPVHIWDTIRDQQDETILSKYYKNPEKYSFPFQMMAYTTRLMMLNKTIKENPHVEIIICERSLEADNHIFAKMLVDDGKIEDVCFQIYKMLYEETSPEYKVDGIVYLAVDSHICLERIGKRSRTGESGIPEDYLKAVEKYYAEWLCGHTVNLSTILTIDGNKDIQYENGEGDAWISQIARFMKIA